MTSKSWRDSGKAFFSFLLLTQEDNRAFHMTSRQPYWCCETMKRWPCWCPKPILLELNSFLVLTLSFVPICIDAGHVSENALIGVSAPRVHFREFKQWRRSDVFERRTSTGSVGFSLLICRKATKFVLLNVVTVVKTICPLLFSKERPKR